MLTWDREQQCAYKPGLLCFAEPGFGTYPRGTWVHTRPLGDLHSPKVSQPSLHSWENSWLCLLPQAGCKEEHMDTGKCTWTLGSAQWLQNVCFPWAQFLSWDVGTGLQSQCKLQAMGSCTSVRSYVTSLISTVLFSANLSLSAAVSHLHCKLNLYVWANAQLKFRSFSPTSEESLGSALCLHRETCHWIKSHRVLLCYKQQTQQGTHLWK